MMEILEAFSPLKKKKKGLIIIIPRALQKSLISYERLSTLI